MGKKRKKFSKDVVIWIFPSLSELSKASSDEEIANLTDYQWNFSFLPVRCDKCGELNILENYGNGFVWHWDGVSSERKGKRVTFDRGGVKESWIFGGKCRKCGSELLAEIVVEKEYSAESSTHSLDSSFINCSPERLLEEDEFIPLVLFRNK